MFLNILNRFQKNLPVDKDISAEQRTVEKSCFSYVTPLKPKQPKLLHFNEEMLENIGLIKSDANSLDFLHIFSGAKIYPDTKPYAMCYGGHQFGNWAGQLGDGRAINLFEIHHLKKHWTLQLKGAGKTPYSRTGDGLAVLRSSIREYLCSEAMYHLGIPTTRSLSLMLSGDDVLRDMLYDHNPAYEKGAIVCRAAESFIRFGNFEIFAHRGDFITLKTLTDYTIKNHFTHLGTPCKKSYIAFFEAVTQRSLSLVLHWQRVGFVHGVLNTDNMSILGLTIDYGPYGWIEGYDHHWTPNTTDIPQKRYSYGKQPNVVLWNLLQLANALYPLIKQAKPLEEILQAYHKNYLAKYEKMMLEKLGVFIPFKKEKDPLKNLEKNLQATETDMTIFFRHLSSIKKNNTAKESFEKVKKAFYQQGEINDTLKKSWEMWFENYLIILKKETLTDQERKAKMDVVNPKYIFRNYMAQMAIDSANKGDYSLIDDFFQLLKKPYDEQPTAEKWFVKRPEWARNKIGCSMLSCSS